MNFCGKTSISVTPEDLAARELGVIVGDASIRDGAGPNSGLGDELSVL